LAADLSLSDGAHRSAFSNCPLFRTTELDEARRRVSQVFCDHNLNIVGRKQTIDAELCYRRIRGLVMGRMRYGASVSIDPNYLESFVLIQMPLSGHETVEHGGFTVLSNASVATVLSPTLPIRMHHADGTEKVFVRIDRDVLERHCRQHLGTDLRQPVEFHPGMVLGDGRAAAWPRLMHWLFGELGQAGTATGNLVESPLFAAQVEQVVIATLLLCQPSNYYDRLTSGVPSIAPYFVKRAEGFIDENAHQPLTIGDIVEHVGVSTRSLFEGFRRFRSTTPMQYLKDVRMQRVRDELLRSSREATTVTEIAVRWGFLHLGHFAVDYKRYFGESPSMTLKR